MHRDRTDGRNGAEEGERWRLKPPSFCEELFTKYSCNCEKFGVFVIQEDLLSCLFHAILHRKLKSGQVDNQRTVLNARQFLLIIFS